MAAKAPQLVPSEVIHAYQEELSQWLDKMPEPWHTAWNAYQTISFDESILGPADIAEVARDYARFMEQLSKRKARKE